MNEESSKSSVGESRLGEIAWAFLRLGFVAFGGAAAHIAMMEQEFVLRRKWLTREDFLDRVGAVSLLPGPSSTELAIYLGELRGGIAGLLVAGCCFILPSAFLVGLLAVAYEKYGTVPQIEAVLFGVKPIVVALILQAVWSLARVAVKSAEMAFLAAVVLGLAAMHVSAIALLIGTGVAWIVTERFSGKSGAAKTAGGVLVQGGAAAAVSTASTVSVPTVTGVFLYFLKVGAVLFGSGYVLLAVLRADLVERLHWLTENQLIDAIAVSQGTPGPFFYGVYVYRICAGRMEGCRTGHGGNVFACVCVGGCDCEILATIERVANGWRISGWSKCGGGGVDGLCGMAVCVGDATECDDDSDGGDCGGVVVAIQGEFSVVGFGRSGGRGGVAISSRWLTAR